MKFQPKPPRIIIKTLIMGAALVSLSACVYSPYPPPPPPPVVAAAPAPGPYYAQPCCYAYPEYPAYYGPAYGSSVNLSFGHGGWGGHHWR